MSSKRKTAHRKKIEVKFIRDEDVHCMFETVENEDKKSGAQKITQCRKRFDISFDCNNLQEEDVTAVEDKPTTLFESGDVGGREIFGFQTPTRRNALAVKAAELTNQSPNTKNIQDKTPVHKKTPSGKTPNTPTSSRRSILGSKTPRDSIADGTCHTVQTPYNLRKKFKRKLIACQEDSSDESEIRDFSASDSEWDGEKSSSESSSEDGEGKEEDGERSVEVQLQTNTKKLAQILPSRGKHLKLKYIPAAEEYFMACSSQKVKTSNHTLGKLRHRLVHDQLVELLEKRKDPHAKHINRLEASAIANFPKWHFLLREGFNIIVYGLGSKRNVLNAFHAELPQPSMVVNGFFPGLTIQEIISSIIEGILDTTFSANDLPGAIDTIKRKFSGQGKQLYIIVHNIDGVNLRNTKSQEILASIASTPNIHMIASIDHINAPLLWDHDILGMFNFLWWDITTFKPYTDETAFESSLLLQRSANLALSSLQNVFRSLTRNAKSIFMLLAEYQKEQKNTSNYGGMPFKRLYSACRESLLVSSDLALRSQLTEFTDHQLIKIRRGQDGSELLLIPIDAGVLDQFMKLQEAS